MRSEIIDFAAGATPGPDIVAAVTSRAGLAGASARTTIPEWTRVERQPGDERHPHPGRDQPLDRVVVV